MRDKYETIEAIAEGELPQFRPNALNFFGGSISESCAEMFERFPKQMYNSNHTLCHTLNSVPGSGVLRYLDWMPQTICTKYPTTGSNGTA